ncbi:MAG: hypothetical protein ND866_25265 [Pyrinomonadaceae bacterium]|nr:hypothetical protein [Pyrinomonadaceae bacterium]
MAKRTFQTLQLLPAALVILSAAIFTCVEAQPLKLTASVVSSPVDFGQQSSEATNKKQNNRPGQLPHPPEISEDSKPVAAAATYSYEFSQPEFYVRHIVIEHDADGRGKITFKRLNEETSVEEPIELSPAVLARLTELWKALRFLESQEDYQAEKQFPHLGTMRIGMTQGARKRTAEFNWSNNASATALVTEYRRVADQAIFVFDISVARENQPLNAPKLMEYMETAMKRNWLSDPQQLIPLLKEISTDDHVPLIARNHALRLLKKLEK